MVSKVNVSQPPPQFPLLKQYIPNNDLVLRCKTFPNNNLSELYHTMSFYDHECISFTLPLFTVLVCPTRVVWNIKPYFGVSFLVFKARNKAFSAPRICTVEAGCLAKLIKEPENQTHVIVDILETTTNSKKVEIMCWCRADNF